jgi:arylformamidase
MTNNHEGIIMLSRIASVCVILGVLAFAQVADPPAAKAKTKDDSPSLAAVLAESTVSSLDRAYGSDEKQKLDIYAPRGAKNAPVVIYIHGGEWTKGDKSQVAFKPKFFVEHGYVMVSVNYRLSPAAKHPDHVSDVASAVRWTVDYISEFGGDPKNIVLMGHSAGCHLVVLTTLDPQYLSKVGLKAKDLRAVVAWSGGSFDLVHKAKTDEKFVNYIRNAFGNEEKAWHDASPVNLTANAKDCPPFLFVTADPEGDSFKVAQRLVKGIEQHGGHAMTLILADRTHKTANQLLGSPDDKTGAQLMEFLRNTSK